jgi:1-carboxybiuret hydrolase subunit AtzG-like
MMKRPKSLRKNKSKKLRAPAATSVRGKGKLRRAKQASRDPLDDFVEAAARALNLKVQPAWKGAVKANLATTFALAASFADFPLPDDAEPAPIFLA